MLRFRLIMLSMLAMLTVGAFALASSASAFNLEWLVCEELSVGVEPPLKFDNHKCNSEVKPLAERKWEFKLLAAGETRLVKSEGGPFKLTGGPIEIKCPTVLDLAHIYGGSPGTDLALHILFEGCTTSKAGCKVKSAGPPTKAGEILLTNIATKLIVTEPGGGGANVEADLFEGTLTGGEKVFVTLELGEEEVAGNKLAKKCGEAVPETTKVTGNVAGETVGSKLVFPAVPLKASTLKAFGKAVQLVGEDEQAVVQSCTEPLSAGWAVIAS